MLDGKSKVNSYRDFFFCNLRRHISLLVHRFVNLHKTVLYRLYLTMADLELALQIASANEFSLTESAEPISAFESQRISVKTKKRGLDILNDPFLSKGDALCGGERTALGLWGLLPSEVVTLDLQIKRVHGIYVSLEPGITQYRFAMSIARTNITLFYAWLERYFTDVAPSIYTPSVGDACLQYGTMSEPLRGVYLNPIFKGIFDKVLSQWKYDVDVVVVTDGGRILGLGDLGAHGMPISVGKLALYTALAGIRPDRTLPISLDAGTNNEQLRSSETYLGWKEKRLGGKEYYELVNELIHAIHSRWPNCLIQFEDFSSSQAWILLEAYMDKVCCFNDDIQGTGSVVAAGILNALRIISLKTKDDISSTMKKGKFVVVGGGSAGYGVCLALLTMIIEHCGMTEEEAADNIFVMDTKGVLPIERAVGDKKPLKFVAKNFSDEKRSMGVTKDDKLIDVIRKVRPCGIIGLTGAPGTFSEEVVREMSSINEDPIIFPLSNPTNKAECTFADALKWSNGKCLFGSGSPFAPVDFNSKKFTASQTNNMYIFPGVGLAAVLSRCRSIPHKMFAVASRVLAYSIPETHLVESRCLFPGLSEVRKISANIAAAAMDEIRATGLSQLPQEEQGKFSLAYVEERMYVPRYRDLIADEKRLDC